MPQKKQKLKTKKEDRYSICMSPAQTTKTGGQKLPDISWLGKVKIPDMEKNYQDFQKAVKARVEKKPKKLLININELRKNNYFDLILSEDFCVSYDIMERGNKEILKELIYQNTLKIFQSHNKIEQSTISIIMSHYKFTEYEDLDTSKHPNTRVHYIKDIPILVNEDEVEYFDQIELAAHDFRKKIKYKTVIDEIMDDLKSAISNKHDELGSTFFANKHFSSENIQLEIRHERFETSGYDNCVEELTKMIFDIKDHEFCFAKIRFIGHKMRPYGLIVKDEKNEKDLFVKGSSRQEENRYGLYVIVKKGEDYIFLFDLDDNNKLNKLTIIHGYTINLYNFVDVDVDPFL